MQQIIYTIINNPISNRNNKIRDNKTNNNTWVEVSCWYLLHIDLISLTCVKSVFHHCCFCLSFFLLLLSNKNYEENSWLSNDTFLRWVLYQLYVGNLLMKIFSVLGFVLLVHWIFTYENKFLCRILRQTQHIKNS